MRYYGKIGFSDTVETTPGVYEQSVVERTYRGDVLSVTKRWDGTQNLNDDLKLNSRISIIADPYIRQNLKSILYAEYFGTKWKVDSVDVQYPRLILSFNGVYNG